MKFFLRILLLMLCCMAGARAAEGQFYKLNFGMVVQDGYEADRVRWQALADYLESQLNDVEVSVEVYDFDGLDQAIQSRSVDFFITGASQYIALSERFGLSAPLVSLVDSAVGEPLSKVGGAILIRADRKDLARLKDLEDKRLPPPARNRSGGTRPRLMSFSGTMSRFPLKTGW